MPKTDALGSLKYDLISRWVSHTVAYVERVWGPVKTITVTFDSNGQGALQEAVLDVEDAHSVVRSTISRVLGINETTAPPPIMPVPGGLKYPK